MEHKQPKRNQSPLGYPRLEHIGAGIGTVEHRSKIGDERPALRRLKAAKAKE